MEIHQVKSDLHNLRKTIHAVAVMAEVRKRQIERLDIILCMPESEDKRQEVENMRFLIELLEVASVSELEKKYMAVIAKLEPIDKTIVLDWLVNGKPYWKIGRDVGYSEDRVYRKICQAVKQIAKMI